MNRFAIYQKAGTDELLREVRAILPLTDAPGEADALIAIGGDGTILNAARLAIPLGIPVLGINAGRVGFLAGLERNELALLSRLATGDFALDERMLLHAQVWQGERIVTEGHCLNDAIIARCGVPNVVDLPVDCGNGHVINYRGDGVIFATPSGSTAYNFSAGGPVAEPGLECVLLTPICNHRSFSRAIVFSGTTAFSVDVTCEGLALTVDAQPSLPLLPGQRVTVRKSGMTARFIRLKAESFLDILSTKMG